MNFDCVIGIDPGSNGGIAVWRPNQKVQTIKMPKNLMDLREYFQYIKTVAKNPIVFLEKVQLRSDDIQANPGKAFRIQNLLMLFRQLKDIMEVEGIPHCLVHPISWQTYLKLRKKNEDKTERKNRYKDAAGHYYPEVKPTLWNADAIMLMHFGRLKQQREPEWIKKNLPSDVLSKLKFD